VHDFAGLPAEEYCYLLGLYLGDGCVSKSARSWVLRITCDTQYPGIIDRWHQGDRRPDARTTRGSLEETEWHVRRCLSLVRALAVPLSTARSRQEALEADQVGAVAESPRRSVQGTVHSRPDRQRRLPCRHHDRGVKSVRYHFSNRSEDILGLYTAALDALGIPWTRPRKHDIAVYRGAATARLDEFVGAQVLNAQGVPGR
jgi:hypothetical protein